MKLHAREPLLSTVFVDYDNIYLSLKRQNEEAAKRFAKDAASWLKEIETGRLITYTNGSVSPSARRIVMTRCYGNPVPRRNPQDNATDMNSFPFVRHNFLRAGFEIIDCPPLTAQLKDSADIRMVMDILDYLGHETRFDEFVILSGDADFTPVLQRLRAHARRTIVFANEYTATPYTAISDGEVRESDLVTFLLEGQLPAPAVARAAEPLPGIEASGLNRAALSAPLHGEAVRQQIVAETLEVLRLAGQPLPVETLAERVVRALGPEKTVAAAWGGAGSFHDLLLDCLPEPFRVSGKPPYMVFDASARPAEPGLRPNMPPAAARAAAGEPAWPPSAPVGEMAPSENRQPGGQTPPGSDALAAQQPMPQRAPVSTPAASAPGSAVARVREDTAAAIQHSIARIHEASKAPPLSPPEYRLLFNLMAMEINAHGLNGAQTITNLLRKGQDEGTEFRRDDVSFVLDAVSEPDPWFEQGASANLFAGRFRNFVVARCRAQGLTLSADELDLIEAWFAGPLPPNRHAASPPAATPHPASPGPGGQAASAPKTSGLASSSGATPPSRPAPVVPPAETPSKKPVAETKPEPRTERWWNAAGAEFPAEEERTRGMAPPAGDAGNDEFPRILRGRIKN